MQLENNLERLREKESYREREKKNQRKRERGPKNETEEEIIEKKEALKPQNFD